MSKNRYPVKSAAALLKKEGAMQGVDVLNVRAISHNLVAMSFVKNDTRYDGTYNVDRPSTMDALLHEPAGFDVTANLSPDSSADDDGFPSVDVAEFVGE